MFAPNRKVSLFVDASKPGADFSSLAMHSLMASFSNWRLFCSHWKSVAWCSPLHELSQLGLLENLLELLDQPLLLILCFQVLEMASFLEPYECFINRTSPELYIFFCSLFTSAFREWKRVRALLWIVLWLRGCWGWLDLLSEPLRLFSKAVSISYHSFFH